MLNTPDVRPELMTAYEVSVRLRVHLNTVYDWARDGRLSPVLVGRLMRFRTDDVDRMVGKA